MEPTGTMSIMLSGQKYLITAPSGVAMTIVRFLLSCKSQQQQGKELSLDNRKAYLSLATTTKLYCVSMSPKEYELLKISAHKYKINFFSLPETNNRRAIFVEGSEFGNLVLFCKQLNMEAYTHGFVKIEPEDKIERSPVKIETSFLYDDHEDDI